MECNKEEAIRAKEIAEKKMKNNDFLGARKIALKAKNLFPELENISQLLAVCDVHCSAQNKICGSEKDWYGILQIEKLADEATIKKQYRKLALVLHPDKNKFPGAEAAFKLIGEAHMVLSDKEKRSLHDVRCRVSLRTAVPNAPSRHANPVVRNSHGVQNKIPTVPTSQFGGLNHHQPTQPDLSNGHQAFWTCCPFCTIKYQYYKKFVNRSLRCQNCSKPFIAYDLGAHDATPVSNQANLGSEGSIHGSSRAQPPVTQQKQVPMKACNMGAHSSGEFPSYNFRSEANSSRKVGSEYVTRTGGTTEVGGGLKNKVKGNAHVNTEANRGVGMSKVDAAKARISGTSRDKKRKRGRKFVVDSSESCNTTSSSDSEGVVFEETGGNPASILNSGPESVHSCRRSSRQKQHVSYNENAIDDDFMSPPKSSHERKYGDAKAYQKEPFNNEEFKVEVNKKEIRRKRSWPTEGSSQYGNDEAVKHQVNVEEDVTLDSGAKKYSAIDDSEAKPNLGSTSDPEVYECPDPEFSDFDKDKDKKCFSVDQIWACYDTIDGMPRFYAQVKKVFSPGFKLRITWLEADPEEQGKIDWVNEGLPMSCGKFTRGDTEETSDRLTFSHVIHFERGLGRGSYVIFPRRGETWALFKDWDIGWSSDSENHKKYIFEIVEILSDFSHDTGIKIGYLAKIKGFVSLFQRTRGGVGSCLIPSSELLRFSHRIPSFKMTGDEREGVPKGSFELDPASLPTNLNELWQPEEKLEVQSMNVKVSSSSKSSDGNVKFMIGSENTSTPKKCVGFEGKNYFDKEVEKLRRSPRELNSTIKKSVHAYSVPIVSQEATAKHLNGLKNQTVDFTPSKRKASSSQGDEEIHIGMAKSPIDLTESPGSRPSFSMGARVSEEVFYDFNMNKSAGKFRPGQIWALYSSTEKFPNIYAQIRKIEPSPFKLYAVLLEPCTFKQPVCCGMFKVPNGKPIVFSPSSFSHLMREESISKIKHEIYPKEGEIWAIYQNWNAELSCPDMKNCKFDIVEVLKANEFCTEVSSLVHLPGFKSVFKAQRRQRSNTGLLTIPRGDLFRFSHQIPAFQLTSVKDGYLRGCWELDPAALPSDMLCKKQDG